LKAISNLWWTFFLVRFNLKTILTWIWSWFFNFLNEIKWNGIFIGNNTKISQRSRRSAPFFVKFWQRLFLGILIYLTQRYRIFFPRNSLIPLNHAFSENFVLSPTFLKKKNVYFFPRKSLKATYSEERQFPQRKRNCCTSSVFFPTNMVFFPRKILLTTHSLILRAGKKYIFELYDFPQKCRFLKLSVLYTVP